MSNVLRFAYPQTCAPGSPGEVGNESARSALEPPTSAHRVPPAGTDFDTRSQRPGALACPVCGEVPSPALMPRTAPSWLTPRLRLRWALLRRLRASEARLTFQPWGWA